MFGVGLISRTGLTVSGLIDRPESEVGDIMADKMPPKS
jgi:hypothetical protein